MTLSPRHRMILPRSCATASASATSPTGSAIVGLPHPKDGSFMSVRESSESELLLLWSGVAEGDYLEESSDGHLRWAFLIDFERQGASALFPGFVGAIVYAENHVGPTGAWFYDSRADLAAAWQRIFSVAAVAVGACR
jgi:hypothetical protein